MLYESKTNFWRKDQKNGQTKMSGFENRGEFEFLVSVGFLKKSQNFSGIVSSNSGKMISFFTLVAPYCDDQKTLMFFWKEADVKC